MPTHASILAWKSPGQRSLEGYGPWSCRELGMTERLHFFTSKHYWSGLPFATPRDLPDPGIEPVSFVSPALAGEFFTTSATWKALLRYN